MKIILKSKIDKLNEKYIIKVSNDNDLSVNSKNVVKIYVYKVSIESTFIKSYTDNINHAFVFNNSMIADKFKDKLEKSIILHGFYMLHKHYKGEHISVEIIKLYENITN